MSRHLVALFLALGCGYDSHVATSGGADAAVGDAQPDLDAASPPVDVATVLALALADLDGDGRDDLAVLDLLPERERPRLVPRLRLLHGRGDVPSDLEGALDDELLGQPFASRALRDGVSVSVAVEGTLASGDFDADGVLDLAVGLSIEDDGAVHLLRGDPRRSRASGLDALPRLTRADEGSFGARVDGLGDLDGDGADELRVEDRSGSVAWVRPGGPLADARLGPEAELPGLGAFRLGDVNGDGRDDVALAELGELAVHAGPIVLPPAGREPIARLSADGAPVHAAHHPAAGGALTVLWRHVDRGDELGVYRASPPGSELIERARLDAAARGCGARADPRAPVVLLGCPSDTCEAGVCSPGAAREESDMNVCVAYLARVAGISLIAALGSACTEDPCPDGRQPRTSTRLVCDEETRECLEVEETACECERSASGCDGDGPNSGGGCDVARAEGGWVDQAPSPAPPVVDGRFTRDEWAGAERLEGLFTDVYMTYREGRLYFLNDWRANVEGIRPDCYNYFQIRIGTTWIDLRVYGHGGVDVRLNDQRVSLAAEGAYGFGPSPTDPRPHTIYEFSLAVAGERIDVCCFDPLSRAECDVLAHEPAVMSLSVRGAREVQVRRSVVPGTVTRLSEGEACGGGEGICVDGLTCVERVCVRRGDGGDAGVGDAGFADAGVVGSEDAGAIEPPM